MTSSSATGLSLTIAQCSDAGPKPTNQDFHGALIPEGAERALKGIAVALADGISSSKVSRIAAEIAVNSVLSDYYCTSDTWTAKTAGEPQFSSSIRMVPAIVYSRPASAIRSV